MIAHPPQASRDAAVRVATILAVVSLYLLIAWPGLHGPFVFDDFPNLAALGHVGTYEGWRDLGNYLSQARFFPGRPLAMLSFLPQAGSWPGDPFAFKAVNLAVHLGNAGLVYLLGTRLAAPTLGDARGRWVAAFAALAWLIHPLQLSSVLLVIQRMTLLSATFTLLGLLAYVHGMTAVGASARRRAAWISVGLVAGSVLAVLCKESGALLPLYAWVIDATVLRGARTAMPDALRRWRNVLIGVAVGGLAAYFAWQMRLLDSPLVGREYTLGQRLLTQPRVLFDYLGQIAWPRYGSLGVFHDDFVFSRGWLTPLSTLPALVGVGAAAWLAIHSRTRRPWLAFGILWFLGGHVLEAGPIPLEIHFEHRNYLPLAGPLLAIAVAIAGLRRADARKAAIAACVVWALNALLATALYARVWSSEDKLAFFWAHAHPASVRAQSLYAGSLYSHGMIDDASRVIASAMKRGPDDAQLRLTSLFLACANGKATLAQVERLRGELMVAPYTMGVHGSLGDLRELAQAGRCAPALDGAAWLGLTDALLRNPAFQHPHTLGFIHHQRHLLAVSRGDLSGAIAELEHTERFDPDPEIARLKARYLHDAGLTAQAISALEGYDASRRPLLRRLLVDDVAINREHAATLRAHANR